MLGSGRSPGERHRRRLFTAACATCLAIGVLIGGLAGSQPVAGKSDRPTAHAADVQTLFGRFTKMDQLMTRAIDGAENGQGVAHIINGIIDLKARTIDKYMALPIDGVPGSIWFYALECVDKNLSTAQTGGDRVQSLKRAKECKVALEHDLHKANETGGSTIGTTVGTPTIGSGG
jgi:hypothetical protein